MDKKFDSAKDEEIQSKAVVKYSVSAPARFTKLQCNTDLNLPPSNWLSTSIDSYGLQNVLYGPQGFTSFRMAHAFPDCVGEVDVVSDAENIKNLLKIPYRKGAVSMMVHRVENTLLIDDFDIYKHILRTAEAEWEWLRKFFFENFQNLSENEQYDSTLYFKNKSRKALQQKNLVSKFLYHSLVDDNTARLDWVDTKSNLPISGPVLPEPSPAEEVPDPNASDHKYNRNVLWTFEDIRMLIGTDMPIFGEGTHPCISLRLRDMTKPINVLTGIDYWLDNLMSNVPEVVMCYHLNGIVQKYELIKTEDLPRLDNSNFSPSVIREVAKSILSFLKTNATKAGHTYWLFKPKDEEVVKLYDLTSLCSKYMVDKDENPFTVPVAMLLYRVARNMRHSCDRQPGTIRMLLKNCIALLNETKYPEIVTSSHYMLADLYVPATTNPESPNLVQEDDKNDNDIVYEDDIMDDQDDDLTKILILNAGKLDKTFANNYRKPPPLNGSIQDRCLQSIHHVAQGLNCLQYFQKTESNANSSTKESKEQDEEEIQMAKPFEPIPMPFKSEDSVASQKSNKKKKKKDKLKKKYAESNNGESSTNALLIKGKEETQMLPTWDDSNHDISWKDYLKILLYKKAELVYATLAEQHYISGNYGDSLRNLGLLVRCHLVVNKLFSSGKSLVESCLLGRTGDCCIMIVQNWDKVEVYQKQYTTNLNEDKQIMVQLESDERLFNIKHSENKLKCVFLSQIRTIEQMLKNAVDFYDEALKYDKTESLLLRLGNSLNEIGTFYLNRARNSKTEALISDSCSKAESYLKKGLEIFETIRNDSNVALLYTNIGHLYRLQAHSNSPNERCELTNKEKFYYNKAFINYKKALQVLGDRSSCPGIWDVVRWELSTALFTMATVLHDYPNPALTRSEAEKETTETLHQALKYCDLDEDNPKYPLYQFRAALIHYRLGCLYHSTVYTEQNDINSRKNAIHLAKLHYGKAAPLFLAAMDPINYFTVQMQKFALFEYLAECSTIPQMKLTYCQNCLSIILEVRSMLELIIKNKIDVENVEVEDANAKGSFKNLFSLLGLMRDRLQSVLRNLTKLCMTKPPINKDCPELLAVYKSSYGLTLTLNNKLDMQELTQKLYSVLEEIERKVDPVRTKN